MAYKNLNEFTTYLNNRTYQKERKYGQDVSVSVFFEHEGERQQLVDHKGRENICNIKNLIKFNPFDKIHVDLHENEKTVSFCFDPKNRPGQELTKKDVQKPELTTQNDMHRQELTGFKGFGQAEVEEIVGKRLAEEKARMDLLDLKEKVIQKDLKIEKLKQTISKLEEKLVESNDEQDRLEGELEAKKTVRYYAGLAGDVLEGIGFDKKKLRQPLAGFLEKEEEREEREEREETEKTPRKIQGPKHDDSGIVGDETNNKSDEVVSMITEFLRKTDNNTLALIYEILVYIENDPQTADYIYSHLKENIKLKKDANV